MTPPVSRTFAPLWEVFRVSSDKLALCHLELTRKLQDLIKDVLRYGEEQLKAHKKVCAVGTTRLVDGGCQRLPGSQDFWGLGTSSPWCVPLRILLIPRHQTQNLTDLSIGEFQSQNSRAGICKLRPAGHIQPTTCFCATLELSIVFPFLSG